MVYTGPVLKKEMKTKQKKKSRNPNTIFYLFIENLISMGWRDGSVDKRLLLPSLTTEFVPRISMVEGENLVL